MMRACLLCDNLLTTKLQHSQEGSHDDIGFVAQMLPAIRMAPKTSLDYGRYVGHVLKLQKDTLRFAQHLFSRVKVSIHAKPPKDPFLLLLVINCCSGNGRGAFLNITSRLYLLDVNHNGLALKAPHIQVPHSALSVRCRDVKYLRHGRVICSSWAACGLLASWRRADTACPQPISLPAL